MSEAIAEMWAAIRTTLQEMGDEAVVNRPFGLRVFCEYQREVLPGCFGKNECERPITIGLAHRLSRKSVNQKRMCAIPEQPYPNGDGRCDVVIGLDGRDLLWMECKTAYKESLCAKGNGFDYEGDSRYEPTGKGSWEAGVWDIGRKDMAHLGKLRPSEAMFIGVLLLGFDRIGNPITEEKLYGLLPRELEKAPWIAAHGQRGGIIQPDRYPPRADKGFRERMWFWYRPVTE